MPGLTDSHCHIFGIGEREMKLNLEGTNTREDFLAKVKERVAQTERGQMDHRPRLDRNVLETAHNFQPAHDLDKIAPDNPDFSRPEPTVMPQSSTSAALKIAEHRRSHARSIRRTKS